MKVENQVIDSARIRALQAIYAEAHHALTQWGLWSRDRRGIFPTLAPPAMWEQFKRDENEDYGDERPLEERQDAPVKAEAAERPEYDEKLAILLDERIHGYGGLPEFQRLAIRMAYVSSEVPEYQFPVHCGCPLDAYCERLEASLRFVGRFIRG